ncbi:class I adenylate-forming enzyme family protein [Thalassovita taeanensis]|uniref:3-methylmercaptopropionyl-CoA ligase n=1 Tax=Thalassovita taeanensis TaxID=657014 RepID=A0A1H9KQU1_9RHOB|nr:AMP-binding protein [Thalassovita taeanensis]SER01203.1 long-chain acyl-CoA synthetase [Thalassovita taeanensis]
MNIALWLARQANIGPDRPALFLGRDCVADYGTFHNRALQVAGWLRAQGIAPGDRVAIFMKNCPDFLIAEYGIWYAGAVVVPINAKLHGREAAWIIEDSGSKIIFSSPGLTEALQQAETDGQIVDIASDQYVAIFTGDLAQPVARRADDLCWLFYTSGTTGRPKGVMITHRMLCTMSLSYLADVDQATGEDAVLYAAPMSHGAGIYNMLHVLLGARHICPPSGGFDEPEIFDLARHHGNIQMFAAPTMVKRMTHVAKETGETGEGLRTIVYAGGPMYLADIIDAVDHFGPIFVQIYGQGEAPMGITALSRDDVTDRSHARWRGRLASVGRAQAAVEVKIGDAAGQEVPRGQAGEIMVRSDVVMSGYWQNEAATAKTIVDGWLLTGDVGFMDEDGYVTMQDRSKDMIISGGTNIYPREVEEALLTHPDVHEVSVVGRDNAEWGEDVVAFVVLGPGAVLDRASLDRHCLDQIARFKRPKDYFALPELPKNNYGKVLKTDLRKRLKEM